MSTSSNALAAVAVATCGFAAAASAASAAYSIGPPSTPFTGTDITNQTWKIGAAGPTMTCSTSAFTGSTAATISPSADFLAAYSGTGSGGSCPWGVLGNAAVAVFGQWTITVTGGGPATYTARIAIPAGSSVTVKPLTVPTCTLSFSDAGNSNLTGLSAVNTVPTGIRIYGTVSNITYTASAGCPGIPSGTRADSVYGAGGDPTSGGIALPGITVAGP